MAPNYAKNEADGPTETPKPHGRLAGVREIKPRRVEGSPALLAPTVIAGGW